VKARKKSRGDGKGNMGQIFQGQRGLDAFTASACSRERQQDCCSRSGDMCLKKSRMNADNFARQSPGDGRFETNFSVSIGILK